MKRWTKICIAALSLNSAMAFAGTAVTLYKSPFCGCCEKYVQYLEQNGFTVKAINETNMDAIQKRYGTARAAGCHTALINGYAVEGHVPVRPGGAAAGRCGWCNQRRGPGPAGSGREVDPSGR